MNMESQKKWLTRITVACFFLSGGIEYSVILPTCWDYMKGLGAKEWLYGLTLAALSISNLIVGPIMGAIYDRTHQTKLLVLFLNFFEIGGNFMYFAAKSKYMILGSRFIIGVGVSAGAVLFGEISRTSTKKERTKVFAIFMSCRQVGLVFGPALNLVLRMTDFHIGPFKVDKNTSPALLMMVVWIIIQLMFVFMFFSLKPVAELEEQEEQQQVVPNRHAPSPPPKQTLPPTTEDILINTMERNNIQDSTKQDEDEFYSFSPSDSEDSPAILSCESSGEKQVPESAVTTATERTALASTKDTLPRTYGSINSPEHSPYSICDIIIKQLKHVCYLINELIREEVVLILGVFFITIFNQMILETALVPLVEKLLGWHEIQVSYFFCGAGIILIISFLVVSVITKKVSDRYLLMVGLASQLLAFAWYVGFVGGGKQVSWEFVQFAVGALGVLVGIAFIVGSSASLYSKLLPTKIQGFGQGVRRSVGSVAAIMGPLWAGAGFELVNDTHYYPFFGVPLVLTIMILVMVLLSFSRLKSK